VEGEHGEQVDSEPGFYVVCSYFFLVRDFIRVFSLGDAREKREEDVNREEEVDREEYETPRRPFILEG
jgi:hypothetical protein